MSGAPVLVLPGPRGFRLAAVAVSDGWFQTAPFTWDPEHRHARPHGAPGGRPGRPADVRGRRRRAVHATRDLAAPERDAAGRRVRRVLQLDADLAGFDAAARAVDPALADDLAGYGGGRLLAGASLFEDVVKGICGTNTTWRQAVASINRLAELGSARVLPRPRRPAAGGRGPPARRRAGRLPGAGDPRGGAGGDRRDPRRHRRRLRRRRRRPRPCRPDRPRGDRSGHRRVRDPADGPLRPALDRLRHHPRGGGPLVRRRPAEAARHPAPDRARRPLPGAGAGVGDAARVAARDGAGQP